MIPEHVVAYAAGVRHVLRCDWPTVAGYLKQIGLGSFHPDELGPAAETWADRHVAPDVLHNLRKGLPNMSKGGRRKVSRERGGANPAKPRSRAGGCSK